MMKQDIANTQETPTERVSLWQRWKKNLQDWVWYHRENPDWYDVDIQSAVKHHIIAPLRREMQHLRHLRQTNKYRWEFPETEHRLGQLMLFGWSLFPRIGSGLRESVLKRRKTSSYHRGRVVAFFDQWKLQPLHFLITAVSVAIVALLLSLYTLGTTAEYNGITLGTVGSARTVNAAVENVESITRQTLNDADYTIDPSLLKTRTRVVPRSQLENSEELQKQLSDQLGMVDYGYGLYVDGELVAATPFAGALDELLEQMKAGYRTPNTVECTFVEDVEIREGYVDSAYMMNLGYIAEILSETKSAEITYTVKSGDVWSEIADVNNMTSDELLALNPGYEPSVLHVGDVLTITNAVPYLTIVNVERQSYLQDVPYSITYEDDASMYEGDFSVLSAGEYGKADITANVTYVNGTETSREVVSSVTLKEPVAERQARGTKPRPTWLPTGNFRWPCNGVITSYFGYRDVDVAGASSFHNALDIANYTGAPIYASDGGTVVHSGWGGGYGYLVKVDHGNGFVTYYAHCSELYVSVGDHVYQGQHIAAMGSTGISSGPHCHFGILKNGTWVDPLNYL